MPRRDYEKPIEILLWIGTTLYGQEIDNLNEELCVAITRFADRLNQLLQSGQKAIVPDAQQWPARNVSHTRGFNDERRGSSFSESPVPIKIVLRNEIGRASCRERGE